MAEQKRSLGRSIARSPLVMGAAVSPNSPEAGAMQERRSAATSASQQPFTVEYDYQVRSGIRGRVDFDSSERSATPFSRKHLESGRLLSVTA